mgnify:CR=1 FL=1
MKRYRPRAQGRGYQILKRSSQISVTLSDDKNYRPLSKAAQRKLAKEAQLAAPADAVAVKSDNAETKTAAKPAAKKAAAKKASAKKAPAKKAAAKKEAK